MHETPQTAYPNQGNEKLTAIALLDFAVMALKMEKDHETQPYADTGQTGRQRIGPGTAHDHHRSVGTEDAR